MLPWGYQGPPRSPPLLRSGGWMVEVRVCGHPKQTWSHGPGGAALGCAVLFPSGPRLLPQRLEPCPPQQPAFRSLRAFFVTASVVLFPNAVPDWERSVRKPKCEGLGMDVRTQRDAPRSPGEQCSCTACTSAPRGSRANTFRSAAKPGR